MKKIQLVKISLLALVLCSISVFIFHDIRNEHQKSLDSNFRKELGDENRKINFLFSGKGTLKEVGLENPGAIEEYIELLLESRKQRIGKYLNDNPHTTISATELQEWEVDFGKKSEELKKFKDESVKKQKNNQED